MAAPTTININLDVPVHMRAYSECGYLFYLFNFQHKVVQVMNVMDRDDGTKEYSWNDVHAVVELDAGLAYYNCGWRVFDLNIQERYAEYVAEKEILNGKS
jgi:hypothetical protein